ncbi:MAG: thiamine pyrophosphate-binding protein, partial [Pseudomonadota bacterium]
MRGADIIARKLKEAGSKTAFGIPGGEVLTLIDGLIGEGIDFVLVKHENAGGFMAEGTWHATGAPAILVATVGPGVANAVNVVANAMQDRVPLIFLTGCVDADEAETYTHQVFDHQAVLAPIVKGTFRATEGAIGVMMDKAIALAVSGQPGPVHVDLPISVAKADSDEIYRSFVPPARPGLPVLESLQEARTRLSNAKRPIAVVGVDALNEGADIAGFCKRFDIPMVATYKAKGMLDESDPLSLGGAGLSPKADEIILPLFETADLILLLGYDPIEMRIGWRDPWSGDKVIEVTSVIRDHGMHDVGLTLLGDVALTVEALKEATPGETWVKGEAA